MARRRRRGREAATVGLALALVLGLQSVARAADGASGASGAAATPANVPRGALMIEIEEALVCQCGCGLTVHACNHLNCPSGIPIKEEVSKRLAAGETKEQILAHFAERYGEKVLSAPTLRGFNLVAWIAPAVFVLLGGGMVAFVARRWSRQTAGQSLSGKSASSIPPAPVGVAHDDPNRERLLREIREFDA